MGRSELESLLGSLGEPRYRADQLQRWLYGHLADDWTAMTDLPLALRRRLGKISRLHTMLPIASARAADDMAVKHLFELSDGQMVEAVLMHYGDQGARVQGTIREAEGEGTAGEIESNPAHGLRHSVCLSTQVGCAMGCVFCATGQMGLVRNLTRGECVEQAVHVARSLSQAGERLGNVVFMGMGEPLANWQATWGTILTLTDRAGFGLSPRRITISTVGLPHGIARLAGEGLPVRLAVSLHAPDDDLRTKLVPANSMYPLASVIDACAEYQRLRRKRITIEYVLIRGVNDRVEQARRLAHVLRPLQAVVNLIPMNPTEGVDLRPSSPAAAAAFRAELLQAAYRCTLRARRGIDVKAGCGQLRSRAVAGRVGRSIGTTSGKAGLHR